MLEESGAVTQSQILSLSKSFYSKKVNILRTGRDLACAERVIAEEVLQLQEKSSMRILGGFQTGEDTLEVLFFRERPGLRKV